VVGFEGSCGIVRGVVVGWDLLVGFGVWGLGCGGGRWKVVVDCVTVIIKQKKTPKK
jgi:hypothetical protein